jgi:hypothetical protein
MKRAILAVLLCTLPLLAADVTGTWTGTGKLPDREVTAHLILKQQGSTITGSIGGSESDQQPIAAGKIEGDQVTMEVPAGNGSYKVSLKLAADGNTLKGEVLRERDGETLKVMLEVKRTK